MMNRDASSRADKEQADRESSSFNKLVPQNESRQNLDEIESKERHGSQYHLRHHLSGCAQTLHAVDLQEVVAPILSPLAEKPLMLDTQWLAPSDIASAVPNAGVHSFTVPFEMPHEMLNAQPAATAASPGVGSSSLSTSQTVMVAEQHTASSPAGVSHLPHSEKPPEVGKPIDMPLTFAGWQVQPGVEADAQGLQLDSAKLNVGDTLLGQSINVVAGETYQFGMFFATSGEAPPPQFSLMINGEAHPLENVKTAGGYHVQTSYEAGSESWLNLAVVVQSPPVIGQTIWLTQIDFGHSGVMPWLPAVEEPVFDFAHLAVMPAVENPSSVSMPALTQILPPAQPDVFMHIESPLSPELPALHLHADLGQTETPQAASAEMHPPAMWLNDSYDSLNIDLDNIALQ